MINRTQLGLATLLILTSCTSQTSSNNNATESVLESENKPASTFATKIQEAHEKKEFLKKDVISFDLQLFFGGKERLNGKIKLATDGTKGRYSLKGGTELIFKHDSVLVSDNYSNQNRARFAAYTWSYFFLMPYKLNDPGTIWENYSDSLLNGTLYKTGKLTFEAGTGDAPDDWYIVYADPESMIMNTAAYIVTAGKSQEQAEKDPHAIQYSGYSEIDGIPIAHRWDFYAWRPKLGLNDTLGYAILENIHFDTFDELEINLDEGFKLIME